jgi:hypothetical protein
LNEFHVAIQVFNNGGATVYPVTTIDVVNAIDFLDHWPMDMATYGAVHTLFTGVADDGIFKVENEIDGCLYFVLRSQDK